MNSLKFAFISDINSSKAPRILAGFSKNISLYFMYFDKDLFSKYKKQMLYIFFGQIGNVINIIILAVQIMNESPSPYNIVGALVIFLLILKTANEINKFTLFIRFLVVPFSLFSLILFN
jgi:hypothetical protein